MKSTDRKILFFDIDGTLITEDGRRYFPDSARRALAQARANGHLVFINTGRVYCNVTDEIKDAGLTALCVAAEHPFTMTAKSCSTMMSAGMCAGI